MSDDGNAKPWARRWRWARALLTLGIVALMAEGVFRMSQQSRIASIRNDIPMAVEFAKQYAARTDGLLAPLDPEPGRLMYDRRIAFEDYGLHGGLVTIEYDKTTPLPLEDNGRTPDIADQRWKDPHTIDDHSVWYLGYLVTDEEEGRQYLQAYRERVESGEGFEAPLEVEPGNGTAGTDKLFRISIDPNAYLVDQGLAPELARAYDPSIIPIFIERPEHTRRHVGGWVWYLSGRTERFLYPGEWPYTEEFIEGLRALDELEPAPAGAE